MQNNHTKYNNIGSRKWILALALFFFTFVLLPLEAQEKLKVGGDLIIKSADSGPPRFGLIARPRQSDPALADSDEGEIYYNNMEDKFRWFDGAGWNTLCSGEEYVATRIVSAYNSLGAKKSDGVTNCVGDGTYCINPKADDNCTCDGTDDQDVINTAINSLPAGKGAVYLLEGTYNIAGEIVLASNTSLIGTGKGTVLKVTADTSNIKVIYASGDRILISQLAIDGNKSESGPDNIGIYFNGVRYSKIDKVWVERMSGFGGTNSGGGIYFGSSSHNIILNSHIRQNYDYGIKINQGDYNIISNNNVEDSGWGIYLYYSAEGSMISHNNVRNNHDVGIAVQGYSHSTMILGNNVQGNGWLGGLRIFSGSYPAWSDLGHHIICGNNVQGNGGTGWIVDTHNIISGNIFYDNGSGFTVSGHGNVISSNRIYDSVGTGYGINVHVDSNSQDTYTYILGNLIDGPGYGGPGYTYDRRIRDPQVVWSETILISNTKYMDKTKISLERVVVAPTNGSTLEVSTSPKAYVALNPQWSAVTLSATKAISDGKAAGDMLILEGRSNSYTVTVPNKNDPLTPNANTILNGAVARILGLDDILTLIWNGAYWVEIGWANNSP